MLRGMMNWIYPESLHVGTAIWIAQSDGRLASDELAQQDDLAPHYAMRGSAGGALCE